MSLPPEKQTPNSKPTKPSEKKQVYVRLGVSNLQEQLKDLPPGGKLYFRPKPKE